MKTIKILAIIAFVALQSCSTTYYQVYETKSNTKTSETSETNDAFVFEDDHCIVTYNLWSEGGNPGFTIYNKTSKTLYLDKFSSFFIINGQAKDYYLDRVFTSGESVVLNSLFYNLSNTADVSTSYAEKAIIAIPSKTQKSISEYNINNNFLVDCDLEKYPSSRKVKTKEYNANESPLTFENRISYFFEKEEQVYEITNSFYISSITNYPITEVIKNVNFEECGEVKYIGATVNNAQSPKRFYNTYSRK